MNKILGCIGGTPEHAQSTGTDQGLAANPGFPPTPAVT